MGLKYRDFLFSWCNIKKYQYLRETLLRFQLKRFDGELIRFETNENEKSAIQNPKKNTHCICAQQNKILTCISSLNAIHLYHLLFPLNRRAERGRGLR